MIHPIVKIAFVAVVFVSLIAWGLVEPISPQMSQELTETLR